MCVAKCEGISGIVAFNDPKGSSRVFHTITAFTSSGLTQYDRVAGRGQGMKSTADEHQFWAWDPYLPVDWRAVDGERAAAGRRMEWADEDDPYVVRYVEYLRMLADGVNPAGPPWQAIRMAQELSRPDGPRLWELRARLLARTFPPYRSGFRLETRGIHRKRRISE
jgi:hypothetical protein